MKNETMLNNKENRLIEKYKASKTQKIVICILLILSTIGIIIINTTETKEKIKIEQNIYYEDKIVEKDLNNSNVEINEIEVPADWIHIDGTRDSQIPLP